MANIPLGWDVEGVIQPKESVDGMLRVMAEKGEEDSGTFWCWDGRVSRVLWHLLPIRIGLMARYSNGV
jgi:hypothetical protein